jgi:hypothetical protein
MAIIAVIAKCKKCGFEIRTDWKFCPNCGDKIVCMGKYKKICSPKKRDDEVVQPIFTKLRKKHFDEMAKIAYALLKGGLEKIRDDYSIICRGNKQQLSKHDLEIRLEKNLDDAINKYGSTKVFGQLFTHIEFEYPDKNIYTLISINPLEYISIIKLVAERKTFQGHCHLYNDWELDS